jgi:hypothetical protein
MNHDLALLLKNAELQIEDFKQDLKLFQMITEVLKVTNVSY